jgi:predicted nucleic acid-binding protein
LYLLDTHIVSADAPAKREVGAQGLASWLRAQGDHPYLSTVTVAEIEAGIARAARIGATTKAERLRLWLSAVEHFYAERILPFGIEEARHARGDPRPGARP